jgi:hypothetical protein
MSGYDIKELVGRGGMGIAWKAMPLQPRRIVVLKQMNPSLLVVESTSKKMAFAVLRLT